MGRNRIIDRNAVLDAAEEIVCTRGASALTIDAVAKEMGITKGGVQYCFGTKEGLIKALFDRWCGGYKTKMASMLNGNKDPAAFVWAHVRILREMSLAQNEKAASLMTVLFQSPKEKEMVRDWYKDFLSGLNAKTAMGRKARLAFVAAEGVSTLRGLGLMELSPEEWDEILEDILSLA